MVRQDRLRRYPPLGGALAAALVAAFVLPSALNIPQSNPTQTLEFAPIPPEDDDPPPPDDANLESLSLGSSSTAPAGEAPGGDGPGAALPPPPEGVGARPITKRCVGNPPRQTEDPMSPPCVGFFDGDNGGATHRGVDAEELRVVVYFDGRIDGSEVTSRGTEPYQEQRWVDFDEPPAQDEFAFDRMIRALSYHFNERFQTYGRRVHFYAYHGDGLWSPEARRADALETVEHADPFAVLAYGSWNINAYIDTLVDKGVVVFAGNPMFAGRGRVGYAADFYRRLGGLIWSYEPSLEERAEVFSTYACQKVVGHPVSFSGNLAENGQSRRFGIVRGNAEVFPDVIAYGELVKQKLEDCGAVFDSEVFSTSSNRGASYCDEGRNNGAALQQQQITTVIFLAGYDSCQTNGFGAVGYRPELVMSAFGVEGINLGGRLQDQTVMAQARAVTPFPRFGLPEESQCFKATREGDANAAYYDVQNFACTFYTDLRQLYTGVQVAGPRLSPEAMDRGFHAIPSIASSDPYTPACFYRPGDYTCVKDAMVQWWDPAGRAPGRDEAGCWRLMEQGKRYLAGTWPEGDVEAQRGDASTDPCNGGGVELT